MTYSTYIHPANANVRLRLTICGAVQGVGFRPFVYRLAEELGLFGWVKNTPNGVFIEVEGTPLNLDRFRDRVQSEKPSISYIQSLESSYLDATGFTDFSIHPSDDAGAVNAAIVPDAATCSECLRDILSPENRRYFYPFTNCTNCGPRYSIIESLPYDRDNTTMSRFAMCEHCQAEYDNPRDRRFHAQPNACPTCGPRLEFWNRRGRVVANHRQALEMAAQAIIEGCTVAVKGIGGFHLIVDATDEAAVQRLRKRKRRGDKPFAVMMASLADIRDYCAVSPAEERLLLSPESPIVILSRRTPASRATLRKSPLSGSIAPGNPTLGLMLPYAPVHHLLMHLLDIPVIATSGNIADETLCVDEHEALERLNAIADYFLVHNRAIARHVDDSIARIVAGREQILRRARGYAPLPIFHRSALPPMIAVGGHLKNSVAISSGRQIILSQHNGDLENLVTFHGFRRSVEDLRRLYDIEPMAVVSDKHPDYLTTRYANESGLPKLEVQHHLAHVLSCMAENDIDGPVLGVAWDGAGLGDDQATWGGEFLKVDSCRYQRFAWLRSFPLPGGDAAARTPRRSAIGLLYEYYRHHAFNFTDLEPIRSCSEQHRRLFAGMLDKRINTPMTSSIGRLFDAVASIIGLRQDIDYEGQAAAALEFAINGIETVECYEFELHAVSDSKRSAIAIDFAAMIRAIIGDCHLRLPIALIAAKFHNTLVNIIVEISRRSGEQRVVLSGGCFQNRYLLESAVCRLQREGFRPYWHQRIPTNDGGLALGQVIGAGRLLGDGDCDVFGC